MLRGRNSQKLPNIKYKLRTHYKVIQRPALCDQNLDTLNSFLKQRLSVAEHFRATDCWNVSNTLNVFRCFIVFADLLLCDTSNTESAFSHRKKSRTDVYRKKETTFISYSNYTIKELKRLPYFGNTLYIQQMSSKDICLEFPLSQMNFLNSFHKRIIVSQPVQSL